MTTRSDLKRLGAALPPLGAVAAYLERAHAAGSIAAHVALEASRDHFVTDVHRVTVQVRTETVRRLRGEPRDVINKQVVTAVRAAFFRLFLVMGLGEQTTMQQAIHIPEQEAFRMGARVLHNDLRAGNPEQNSGFSGAEDVAAMATRFVGRVRAHTIEVFAAAKARTILQDRYLGGHPALFPDTASLETQLATAAISLVEIAALIAEAVPLLAPLEGNIPKFPDLRLAVLQQEAETAAVSRAKEIVELTRLVIAR
jgi:hypothetical protein